MEPNCKVVVYVSGLQRNIFINTYSALYFYYTILLCYCRRSFIWFLVRMAIFAAALIIAARPDLDNPGCYRNSLDYFRLVLEVISLICFIMKGYDEIVEMAE